MRTIAITSLICILFFTIQACSRGSAQQEEPQDGILSEQHMKEILVELHLTEATVNEIYLPGDTIREGADEIYNDVFSRHGTNAKDFLQNIEYYSTQSNRLHKVMEQVVDSLNTLDNPQQ
ncbi:MAG: DUF4296 domain-containing protein [Flavobacteriales bacterium]